MAKWTPEQIKEKLALWISAENVRVEQENIYGTSVTFVKEVLDLSGNQNNAYNLDSTNVTRPRKIENAINGLPSISFSDFDLSKAGETGGDYSANNYVVPDNLIIDHTEEMDFSENGASIFIVFKPNLKRELGYKFLRKYHEDNYDSKALRDLLASGYENLEFPSDSFINSTLDAFENNDVIRSADSKINNLSSILPTLWNSPGFQVRLQIDDLYANENADDYAKINAFRASLGLPALITSAAEDTFGDDKLDYLTERGNSGLYKVKTVSSFGASPYYTSIDSSSKNKSYQRKFYSSLDKSSGAESAFNSLGIKSGPDFNESYDDVTRINKYTELHRSSNSRFYEPFDTDFSILSIVTNTTTGSINDSGDYDTWESSSSRSGFFKNGQHFGGNNSILAVPSTERVSGWIHSIGAPLDLESGRVKGNHDTLDWNVTGSELDKTLSKEAASVKKILDEASRYGASSNDLSADFFAGEIAEIVICKEELTVENRQKMEGYFAAKYAIPLVSGHPDGINAPSYDETSLPFSPLEIDSLTMWVDADDVLKGESSSSRLVNPNFGQRNYYSANEDVRSYFTAKEDTAEYVKRFNDKTDFRNDLTSLESGAVGSKSWPLYAAKQLSNQVNQKPVVDFEKAPRRNSEYSLTASNPRFISTGEYTNIKYTNTTSSIRAGGIYLKATPKDSNYDYPSRDKSWIESRRLIIRDKASMDFILKEKSLFFDKSNFELIITVESGLGDNYFQRDDIILLTGADTTHNPLFNPNKLYQVWSYNNDNGEITANLNPEYSIIASQVASRDLAIGVYPNPVILGNVTKIEFDFAAPSATPYYASTSDEYKKFKNNGATFIFVMKPDDGSSKQYLLTNGSYSNGQSPLWITVGGGAQSGGSDAVPAQLRFAYENSSTVQLSGTTSFRVNANGSGQKYYSITFDSTVYRSYPLPSSSTSFDTTNNGETLANAYTATIYTGHLSNQSDVIDLLIDLFNSNPFDQNSWNLSKVNSQVAGAGGSNNQLNITGPNGDSSFNITNIDENVASLRVDSSAGIAGTNPSESGTNAVGINDLTIADVVSTSSYGIYEFVVPGINEDTSSLSQAEIEQLYGIWKNGVKKLDISPDDIEENWGTKESRDDERIYVVPPVSSDTCFRGAIAEILVFSEGLSVDERQRIEGDLAFKYGITLPDTHPYSSGRSTTLNVIKWSPKNNPEDLFAWYSPETIEDDGYGTVRWLDQHQTYRTDANDHRHLNPLRNFTNYQPNPMSSEIASSAVPSSDVLTNEINGLKAVRIRPDKGMAFYGFNNVASTKGFTAFYVTKYIESSNVQASDWNIGEDGSILELANQFHNENNDSPKTRYHFSISDTIDGYANDSYDNNLESIYLEPNSRNKLSRGSSLSDDDSLTPDSYQILSLTSRYKKGSNTRDQGFYSNGSAKGFSQSSHFDVDTIVLSGGNYDISVAEVILYDKELTDFERQRVEGYLAHKYNLQNLLEATHPYKYFSPEIEITKQKIALKSLSIASNTDLWTPQGKDDLIGLYTPDNIVYRYDHSPNGFSATIAPLGTFVSQTHPVVGVTFGDSIGKKMSIHSGVESAYYEEVISSESASDAKTEQIADRVYNAVNAIRAAVNALVQD